MRYFTSYLKKVILLHITRVTCNALPPTLVTRDTNNPQANDFTVDKTKLYDQKLSNTQKSHAAVYFCSYWDTSSGHSEKIYSHPVHELMNKIFIAHTVICDFWLSNVSHICYEHLNRCEDIHEIFVVYVVIMI